MQPGAFVLVEGDSDAVAIHVAASVLDVDLAHVSVVSLGGVTNMRRALVEVVRDGGEVRGLCDAAEAPIVVRALRHVGYAVPAPDDLPAAGFWVCEQDLEDELIRAAGAPRVLRVLDETGLRRSFASMSGQPAWRERPFEEQVRRFIGAGSGRKAALARALTESLAGDELPAPIAELLRSLPG